MFRNYFYGSNKSDVLLKFVKASKDKRKDSKLSKELIKRLFEEGTIDRDNIIEPKDV